MFYPVRLLALLLAISFYSVSVNAIGEYEIQPEELLEQISTEHKPLIIDVRAQDDYLNGHVPTAIHIEHLDIKNKIHTLLPYKDKPIVIYCGDSTRSAIAMTALKKEGFQRVVNLYGHFFNWERKNLPTETTVNRIGVNQQE